MADLRWRWLESAAAPGAEQMAVDAGLLARARETGEATVRIFAWTRPTLSFGRHETVRDRFSAATLAMHGVDAVRRPTGGRVLLHEGEVTYSVTAPAPDDEPIRVAFARVNGLLMDALARLGVPVAEAPRARPLRPARLACFAEPSAGELIVDGRKLVASAQVREGGALLQHGSILLDDVQSRIPTLADSTMEPPAPGATLRTALGRPVSREEVWDAVHAALEAVAGRAEPLDPAEAGRWAEPLRARFADPQWTWAR